MKNSMNKGFITYLMLFLGIVLGVVMVVGLIMYFSPGTDVMGYVFYTQNVKSVIQSVDGADLGYQTIILDEEGEEIPAEADDITPINFSNINSIVINTNGMNVHFIHGPEDRIDVIRNVNGFAKVETLTDFTVTKNYNPITKVLTITTIDNYPDLSIIKDCSIEVYIANQTPNLAAVVTTNSALVNVAVNAFDIQTTKDLTFRSLDFTTQTGNIKVFENATVTNFVDLKVTNANITVSAMGATETNKMNAVTLEVAENGTVFADNIYATSTTFNGETAFITADNIYSNVFFNVVRGSIKAENVYGDFIDVEGVVKNSTIELKEVSGEFLIPDAEKTNIMLDKVSDRISITTTTGTVFIKQATDFIDITTTSGSVTIAISEDNTSQLNITTVSGAIDLTLNSVVSAKNVTSQTGTINLLYKTGLVFKLVATTTATINLVNEDLTFANTTVTGYPTTADFEFLTDNVVTLTTGANITIDSLVNII